MNTLQYIADKYKINIHQKRQPVEIPNTTRDDLATLFAELGFTKGAEIGVEEGLYSEVLCKANQNLELLSIDAWAAYHGYRDHTTQSKIDDIYERAKQRLAPYNDKLIKGYSLEVAETIPDESLDFVYIDANHEFVHVVNDIAAWERKVKVGGIIAGHDYIKRKTNGYLMHVIMAIHGFIDSYQIRPLFVLGRKEAHSNLDPKKGELREGTRSWFYVKPPKDPMKPGWSGWDKF